MLASSPCKEHASFFLVPHLPVSLSHDCKHIYVILTNSLIIMIKSGKDLTNFYIYN